MIEKYKLYNGEIELRFDPSLHLYTVNDKIVYGVTSICGVLNKPALIPWAVNQTINYINFALAPGMVIDEVNKLSILSEAKSAHRKTTTQAADIGTAVHNYLEKYLKAGIAKQALPALPINPEIRRGVSAVLNWAKEHKVKFLSSERKIYSKKYEYAGTLDAEATVDGKLAIIDFKTSSGIYSEYFLQTAAYAQALEEEKREGYEEIWILRIPKTGTEFGYAKVENLNIYFQSFLGCLENYKRQMWEKGEKIKEIKIKLTNGIN